MPKSRYFSYYFCPKRAIPVRNSSKLTRRARRPYVPTVPRHTTNSTMKGVGCWRVGECPKHCPRCMRHPKRCPTLRACPKSSTPCCMRAPKQCPALAMPPQCPALPGYHACPQRRPAACPFTPVGGLKNVSKSKFLPSKLPFFKASHGKKNGGDAFSGLLGEDRPPITPPVC